MGCVEIEVTRVPIEEIQTMIQERKKLHENFLSMWEPFKAGASRKNEEIAKLLFLCRDKLCEQ